MEKNIVPNRELESIRKLRNYTVVKSNQLVQQSRFDLSAFEQKLLIYIISQIKPEDTEFKTYEIAIREFCKICGIDYKNGGNYALVKKTIENMAQQFIWIEIDDEETMIRIIERPFINKKTGLIKIKLDNMMQEHLLFLKDRGNKTIYNAIFAYPMKSKYALRFYDLLHSYANQRFIRISLDTLLKWLFVENKPSYQKYNDFRKRVLTPAINEINKYTDLNILFSATRTGRKITHINFSIAFKNDNDTINICDQNNLLLDSVNFKDVNVPDNIIL